MTKLVLVGLAWLTLGFSVNSWWLAAGMLLDASSHYVVDRKVPLEKLARWMRKGEFHNLGSDTVHTSGLAGTHLGTGRYALDQSFHHLFLLVGALIAAI